MMIRNIRKESRCAFYLEICRPFALFSVKESLTNHKINVNTNMESHLNSNTNPKKGGMKDKKLTQTKKVT